MEIIPSAVNEFPASSRNAVGAVIPICPVFVPSICEAIVAKNIGTSINLLTALEHDERLWVKIIASPTNRLP